MAMDPIGTPRRPTDVNALVTSLGGLDMNNMTTEHGNPSAATYWARYDELRHVEAEKDKLLRDILTRYTNLACAYNEQFGASVPRSKDLLVQQLQDLEATYAAQYARWNDILTRDPYVVVLIDGTGMFFEDKFICQGEEGGRRAAHVLTTLVRQWAAVTINAPLIKVSIRIYADVKKLISVLLSARILNSPTLIKDFVHGFTCSDALCDFIDVPDNEDRVGAKLRANLDIHLNNIQCKQILLGCSHENTYAGYLETLAYDTERQGHVTLLEGVPFVEELAALPVTKHRFPGLFRSRKPVTSDHVDVNNNVRPDSRNTSSFNPNSGCFTPSAKAATQHQHISSLTKSTVQPASTRTSSLASSEISDAVLGASIPGGPAAWSHVAQRARNLPYTDLTQPAPEPSSKVNVLGVRVNKQGYRIDSPMEYDHDKVYAMKQYKLCNQHYIGKGCCHHNKGNNNCPHMHDRILSKEDLKWLRAVSRETVCKRGLFCRDIECIYGHQCPYPKQTEGSLRGASCVNGSNCRFTLEMHGMDVKVHRVIPAGAPELEA